MSLTVNRAYGQLKRTFRDASRFAAKSQTRLTLTLHATSIAGGRWRTQR